jgi:hypothetical protein
MAGTGAAFGTFIGRENRENWTVIRKQLFGPGAFLIGYPREKRGTRGSVQTTSTKNGPSPAPGPSTQVAGFSSWSRFWGCQPKAGFDVWRNPSFLSGKNMQLRAAHAYLRGRGSRVELASVEETVNLIAAICLGRFLKTIFH